MPQTHHSLYSSANWYLYHFLLYLLLGSQLSYLFGHLPITLLALSVFFFALNFLFPPEYPTSQNQIYLCLIGLFFSQLTLSMLQPPSFLFYASLLCFFIAIGPLLTLPSYQQTFSVRALFNASMPLAGMLSAIAIFKHFASLYVSIFPIIPIVLLACLCFNQPPKPSAPTSHTNASFYWLNIGWVWISLCAYFFQEGRFLSPLHQTIFLTGVISAYYSPHCQYLSAWKTNSTAYWIALHSITFLCLPIDDAPITFTSASIGFLFAFASSKIMFSSLARCYSSQQDQFLLLNNAVFLLSLVIYPLFFEFHSLFLLSATALVMLNAHIIDASSCIHASACGLTQFLLHRIGVRYSGLQYLCHEKNKPIIFIANHSCFLDVPLIASLFDEILTYPIYPFWLDYWSVRVLGGRFANLYAMKPSQPNSLSSVVRAIQRGQKCLIFPEGRLSDTGNLMKIFDGTAALALHAKADLQPVIINGGMNLVCSRHDFRHVKRFFSPISVAFGPRLTLPDTNASGKEKRQIIRHFIYKSLTETYMSSYADLTLPDMLNDAMRRYGKKRLALRDNNYLNDMTYSQLIQKSQLIARRLKIANIQPGSVLAVTINHGADSAALLFACFALEIIALPVDNDVSLSALQNLLSDLPIAGIVIDHNTWPPSSHTMHFQMLNHHQRPILDFHSLVAPQSYSETIDQRLTPLHHIHNKPDSIPAVVFYDTQHRTSTILSHKNMVQQAYQLHIVCDLHGKDIVMNATGLHHCYGMIMGLLLPLVSGTELFLTTTDFHPKSLIDSIYETQTSVLIANANLLKTHAPNDRDSFDTLRLRCVFSNHTPSTQTRKKWEFNCKTYLFSVWTAPDQSGIIACNTPYYHNPKSLGQLLPLNHIIDQTQKTISGPLCPHFIYKKGPTPYKKAPRNTTMTLPSAVYINAHGLLFTTPPSPSTET